jgi:DNA-binding NarL/FixJ family response regulator
MVRILIADDRELIRATLRQALPQAEASWHVCGEAGNGREAIEKAAELAPDLIIMDIAMPVLDGIGATRAIRAQLPDVPIVMYTFLFFDHLELMVKQAGAQALVQKGDLRALVGEIRKVLAATPATAGQATSDGDSVEMLSTSIASTGCAGGSAEAEALQEEVPEDSASGDAWPDGEVDPGS